MLLNNKSKHINKLLLVIHFLLLLSSISLIFPTHRECSDGLKKLFSMMISKDPNTRASIEDIADNAWINEGYATPLSKEL